MELRVLGQLEASDGATSLDLGPPKQRAVLARLAFDANRTLRLETLLDDVWGDDLPRSAPKMVHIYISQLRKVLPDGRLRTEGGGYRLALGGGERGGDPGGQPRAAARDAQARGEPAVAAARLAEALALWRGPALGDLSGPFAERERARLEDLRLACQEERIAADIDAGTGADVIGELEALISGFPLRERPRALQMVALYRAGRQAEALEVFQAFRRTLDEELGLEPSESLRELQGAILRQELPATATPGARPAPGAGPATPLLTPFAALPGRDAELDILADLYGVIFAGLRRMVFVTGPAGIGKTALVEAFTRGLTDTCLGHGQCVETTGPDEAYQPFLDALSHLTRRDDAVSILEAVAPSWAVHVGEGDIPESTAIRAQGATAQRMQREAVRGLEALAEREPTVLVLEDLHWADEATLELLSIILRRSRSARLLIVATLRPGSAAADRLVDEARGQRTAIELPLAPLDVDAVGETLSQRLDGASIPPPLAGVLHERSGGNPLFAGLVVDEWTAEHALAVEGGVVEAKRDIGALAV